jgi:hypothetical protein
MKMFIENLFVQYWGIAALAVLGVAYFVTHKKIALAYAKRKISSLMLAAEKGAEDLVLSNGQAKLQWVVDKGYDIMPSAVRLFISKPLFTTLVQILFNEAKGLVESHKKAQPAVASVAVVAPITSPLTISGNTVSGSNG